MAESEQKNRPQDTPFKQQRLRAWQPILTPGWVIFTFSAVGALFLAIGIVVLDASNTVVEISSSSYQDSTTGCPSSAADTTSTSCLVDISVTLSDDMDAPIYMYYQLKNFYQNHRRYVKSRSDVQLRDDGNYDVDGNCEPLATSDCSGTDSTGADVSGTCAGYPCGLIAWSVFNDTFYSGNSTAASYSTEYMLVNRDGEDMAVSWTNENIAWQSDKDKKFKVTTDITPIGKITGNPTSSSAIAMPYANYKYFLCANDSITDLDDCPANMRYADVSNEEFIVWMRTSGLPDFRKLHRIINTDLKKGDVISLKVNNVFPVTAFGGEKKIVFSTTTWIGGKNQFLGWAYIVVAILCLLLAIAFFVKHQVHPRELKTSQTLQDTVSGAAH